MDRGPARLSCALVARLEAFDEVVHVRVLQAVDAGASFCRRRFRIRDRNHSAGMRPAESARSQQNRRALGERQWYFGWPGSICCQTPIARRAQGSPGNNMSSRRHLARRRSARALRACRLGNPSKRGEGHERSTKSRGSLERASRAGGIDVWSSTESRGVVVVTDAKVSSGRRHAHRAPRARFPGDSAARRRTPPRPPDAMRPAGSGRRNARRRRLLLDVRFG